MNGHSMQKLRFCGFFALVSLVLSACGGDNTSPPKSPATTPTLVSVAVTPASASVPKGLTQQLTATGTYSDNTTAVLTQGVNWTSGMPGVATVDASTGLVTSVSIGSTVITATSGTVSGSTTMNVAAPVLTAIGINPSPFQPYGEYFPSPVIRPTGIPWGAFIGVGLTWQHVVIGQYSDNTFADVTSSATWSSSTPTVATVDATGLTTGVSLGKTTLSASVGSMTVTESLSVVTGHWTETAGKPIGSGSTATATLLANGQVLLAGSGNVQLYNPASGVWSLTGSLTTPRYSHTTTLLLNGKVLVVGGQRQFTSEGPITNAEIYDPDAGTWSTVSQTMPRVHHTATLLSTGKVLVTGGTLTNLSVTASAELYDPESGTWSSTSSLSMPRTSHTATLLPNGQVLVVGGITTGVNSPTTPSAEIYDPASGTWSATGSLSTSRAFHTATALLNGDVLVTAGETLPNSAVDGNPYLASTEIYHPSTGTWTTTGSLKTGRIQHAATLLADGRVLVAGANAGYNTGAGGGCRGLTDIYDPLAGTWTSIVEYSYIGCGGTVALLTNGMVLGVDGQFSLLIW